MSKRIVGYAVGHRFGGEATRFATGAEAAYGCLPLSFDRQRALVLFRREDAVKLADNCCTIFRIVRKSALALAAKAEPTPAPRRARSGGGRREKVG